MKVCVYDKNHKMKISLLSHYIRCHENEYRKSKKEGLYCLNNPLNVFANKVQKGKHDKDCAFCGNKKSKIEEDISKTGYDIIEKKMPEEKRNIKFPRFDFDIYIKKNKENNYLKNGSSKNFNYEESNILY